MEGLLEDSHGLGREAVKGVARCVRLTSIGGEAGCGGLAADGLTRRGFHDVRQEATDDRHNMCPVVGGSIEA